MSELDETIDAATRNVMEFLAPIGPVVARPLFGTQGLYLEDRIFGLVAEGRTYFRTTEVTAGRYVGSGSKPFEYQRQDGERTVMGYHEVPAHVLEDRDLACAWAYEAAAADSRARS